MNIHIKGDLIEYALMQTPTRVTYWILSMNSDEDKFNKYLEWLLEKGGERWMYDHLKGLEEFINNQYNNVTWFAA